MILKHPQTRCFLWGSNLESCNLDIFFSKSRQGHSLRLAWPQRLWEKLRKWGSCVFKSHGFIVIFPAMAILGKTGRFFPHFQVDPCQWLTPWRPKDVEPRVPTWGDSRIFFWQILTDPDLSANTSHEPWAITSNLILESKHEHHSIWAYLGYTHLPRISTLDSWMQVYIRWISPHAFHLHEPYKVVPSSFGLVYKPH